LAYDAEIGPQTRYTLQGKTASMMKGLVCFLLLGHWYHSRYL